VNVERGKDHKAGERLGPERLWPRCGYLYPDCFFRFFEIRLFIDKLLKISGNALIAFSTN
jgi:hypothetical protein